MAEPLLRPFQADDAPALARVYRDAVTGTGATAYDPVQVAIWANFPADLEAFRNSLLCGLTQIASVNGRPIGFGQLHPVDHIALLYTAPDHGRRGIAGAICSRLEQNAAAAGQRLLRTEASRIARPFFERRGYTLVEAEYPQYGGVVFERFRMLKVLV